MYELIHSYTYSSGCMLFCDLDLIKGVDLIIYGNRY